MKILECVDIIYTRKVIKTSLSIEGRWQPFSHKLLITSISFIFFESLGAMSLVFAAKIFSALEGISNLYSLKFRLLSDIVPGTFCLQWFSHISVLHFLPKQSRNYVQAQVNHIYPGLILWNKFWNHSTTIAVLCSSQLIQVFRSLCHV